jgi:hypothetical protein
VREGPEGGETDRFLVGEAVPDPVTGNDVEAVVREESGQSDVWFSGDDLGREEGRGGVRERGRERVTCPGGWMCLDCLYLRSPIALERLRLPFTLPT